MLTGDRRKCTALCQDWRIAKRGTLAAVSPELNRRTFVGASVAVTGAVAAGPLLAGCGSHETAESTVRLRMRVNGQPTDVEVDTRTSLLDMLREYLGLTGTKKGCDQG